MTTSSSHPDLSGRYVGRYLLTSLLGLGAGGRVYRAVDTSSSHQRSYAIKCISKVNRSQEQIMQQALEISLHSKVSGSSSHILSLREVIQDKRYFWVVLDLCEGGDLHMAIWRSRIFKGEDRLIKQAFVEILDGVSACHQRGVFHRDLKPENILCNADGTGIRIADFGHATRERLCRGILCGTRPYVSPEYWVGHENNMTIPLLADIWSLGIILINMVTSRMPWEVAHLSDNNFRAFMNEKDYLYNTYPISRKLNTLLMWILHPRAHRRISIPQIREAIMEMDTFYRRPSLPHAAWSREVVYKQEAKLYDSSGNSGNYPSTASGTRNIENPPVVCEDVDSELPHAKVWGSVREQWVVDGVEISPAKPAGRRLL